MDDKSRNVFSTPDVDSSDISGFIDRSFSSIKMGYINEAIERNEQKELEREIQERREKFRLKHINLPVEDMYYQGNSLLESLSNKILVKKQRHGFFSYKLKSTEKKEIERFMNLLLDSYEGACEAVIEIACNFHKVHKIFSDYLTQIMGVRKFDRIRNGSKTFEFQQIVNCMAQHEWKGDHSLSALLAACVVCVVYEKVFVFEVVAPYEYLVYFPEISPLEICTFEQAYGKSENYRVSKLLMPVLLDFSAEQYNKDDDEFLFTSGALDIGISRLCLTLQSIFNKYRFFPVDFPLAMWVLFIKRSNLPVRNRTNFDIWSDESSLKKLEEVLQIELMLINRATDLVSIDLGSVSAEEGLAALRRIGSFLNDPGPHYEFVDIKGYVEKHFSRCVSRRIDGSVCGYEIIPALRREEKVSPFLSSEFAGLTKLDALAEGYVSNVMTNYAKVSNDLGVRSFKDLKRIFSPDESFEGVVYSGIVEPIYDIFPTLVAKAEKVKVYLALPLKIEEVVGQHLHELAQVRALSILLSESGATQEITETSVLRDIREYMQRELHLVDGRAIQYVYHVQAVGKKVEGLTNPLQKAEFFTQDPWVAILYACAGNYSSQQELFIEAQQIASNSLFPELSDFCITAFQDSKLINKHVLEPYKVSFTLWDVPLTVNLSLTKILSLHYKSDVSTVVDPGTTAQIAVLADQAMWYLDRGLKNEAKAFSGDEIAKAVFLQEVHKRFLKSLFSHLRETELFKLTRQYIWSVIEKRLMEASDYHIRKRSIKCTNFTHNFITFLTLKFLNAEFRLYPADVENFIQEAISNPSVATSTQVA